jgi:transcriptional regulator with XRE-family HTH domain
MQEKLSIKEIAQRIKSLRLEIGHSQQFMADLLEISRSNYSQIELGNHYPTYELLFGIARYYGKSYEWLLHGNEDINFKQENYINVTRELPSSIQNQDVILKISSNSDYIKKLNDSTYLKKLPSFDDSFLVLKEGGCYRAFSVENSSNLKNIYTGDVLIGKLLKSLSFIKLNGIYIIVTLTEIIFCRIVNVIGNGEMLICRNDESDKSFALNFGDIQEIWIAEGKYSKVIQPSTETIEKVIFAMNEAISSLEMKLNKLNKKIK